MIDIAGRSVLGAPVGEAQHEAAAVMNAYASIDGAVVLHAVRTDDGDLLDHVIVSGTDVHVVYSSRPKPKRRIRKDIASQITRRSGALKVSFVEIDRHSIERTCARLMTKRANDEMVADLADLLLTPVRPTGLIAAGVPA